VTLFQDHAYEADAGQARINRLDVLALAMWTECPCACNSAIHWPLVSKAVSFDHQVNWEMTAVSARQQKMNKAVDSDAKRPEDGDCDVPR